MPIYLSALLGSVGGYPKVKFSDGIFWNGMLPRIEFTGPARQHFVGGHLEGSGPEAELI